MPRARVVSFDGVSRDPMAEMQREMQDGERPEDVPAKEIIVLHDPEAEKSLVIIFFDCSRDRLRRRRARGGRLPRGDPRAFGRGRLAELDGCVPALLAALQI